MCRFSWPLEGGVIFLLKTPGVRDCPVVVHDEGGSRAPTGVPSGKHVAIDNRARLMADLGAKHKS